MLRGARDPAIGLIAAVALLLALRGSGIISGSVGALEEIGFDPDRARLIMGLTAAALAAAVSALASGRRIIPILAAYLGLAAVFGPTFLDETAAAIATHGADGFRPLGWLATLVTLVLSCLATGWAFATLALEIRRWVLDLTVLPQTVARGARPGRLRRLHALALVLVVAAVGASLPTLGDMINYTPDVAMTGGGLQQAPPLVGGPAPGATDGAASAGGVGTSAPAGPSGQTGQSPAAGGTGAVTPGAIATTQPWAARPPVGQGSMVAFALPSPWVDGRATTSTVWLYLPPGYQAGTQRYPVVYTVPWDLAHWAMGIHVTALLDEAITNGTLPAEIVAFVDLAGGPFPNSECADSYDGREHADTYVSSTVVRYVDSHYRTIADPRARTVAGFSQGGFCAANLLMRHPAVFNQAVIFAGYFEAGLRSGETVNAWMPFGHVASVVAANSPMQTADAIPPAARRRLFVVLAAQPGLGVFGQQASQFAQVLARDGYPTALLWNQLGHAWKAVRLEFIPALRAVAERQVQTGVLQ
jgi:enterochelin esterase-like enzyme